MPGSADEPCDAGSEPGSAGALDVGFEMDTVGGCAPMEDCWFSAGTLVDDSAADPATTLGLEFSVVAAAD